VIIRLRTDDDLDACIAIVQRVHERDNYPAFLPDNDYRRLLTRPTALAAYVATDGDRVVGHAALHASRPGAATELASRELSCDLPQLGVVARLFTDPIRRRAGLARALLEAVTADARNRDLVPILDVWVELRPAVAFYDACGWRRLGTVDVNLPDGTTFTEYVFTAPR
jgi:GNAT superfamily N-acetyltransferase